MPAKAQPTFASERALLSAFGERLRLARLRRKLSGEVVAQRSGISRVTLHRAEKGDPAVTLGTYLKILGVLRLESDLALLAKDDELGRRIQDLDLPQKRKARGTT
jgi:transcriptional regulator with XRE-family HTH domain